METREKLLALSDLVEKLTRPCQETDCRVKAAIYGGVALKLPHSSSWCLYVDENVEPHHRRIFRRPRDVPHGVWVADNYTASVDAAITLIPSDFQWWVGRDKPTTGGAWAEVQSSHTRLQTTIAATPALALTAAALRARAAAVE